ncbi:MAG TPA: nuclear transport factor 2 family protein [Candidatus Saccharimonadales bacterium]|nr:nuclear transport factor 2 family protein [Candidatus Saccharimonadales bacterium]
MTRYKALCATSLIALLVVGSFVFGFNACLHLKSSASGEIRRQYLRPAGDAPPSVKAGVLVALRAFQEGYTKRDPKEINAFMTRLFPRNGDVLLLGTDTGEWARGYPAVSEFIKNDWERWGNFSFSADDSIISSAGDVAWIASVGVLRDAAADRPLRFSAILARSENKWVFRQVHFQWDDRDPATADLFQPSTHVKIAKLLVNQFRRINLRFRSTAY